MPLRQRLLRYLVSTVFTALLLGAAWVWLALHWSYADGMQAGRLFEVTRRGWVCKTWEGRLDPDPPGATTAPAFHFTVRDDGIARQLQGLAGRFVRLHYREYRLMPSDCFGETGFVVIAVEEQPVPANLPVLSTPLPASAPAPADTSAPPFTPQPASSAQATSEAGAGASAAPAPAVVGSPPPPEGAAPAPTPLPESD